jgi:mannosyltransferase
MFYLDNIIFSLQHSGGISVVWYNILNSLIEGNMPFHCLEYPDAANNIFRRQIELPYDKISYCKQTFLPIARYMPVRITDKKPFIFHSSYYRYCLNKKAVNITTVHDFTYEYFASGIRKMFHCRQKYATIRHSDIIVCISENTKRDLLKFLPDIDPAKIRIIYNGVSEAYRPVEDKISELEEYALFVGARDEYKNFRFVVDSLQETSLKLAVCGKPLTPEEKQDLDCKLGPSRYKVYENIDNEELNRLYNSVYCLAYPSSYEGFGIPVIEAQRAGCPVIAMNASSIPEIIGETPLLIPSLDKETFIGRLKILHSETKRKEIIEHGLTNSLRFSWQKTSGEYMSLYNNVLKIRCGGG